MSQVRAKKKKETATKTIRRTHAEIGAHLTGASAICLWIGNVPE